MASFPKVKSESETWGGPFTEKKMKRNTSKVEFLGFGFSELHPLFMIKYSKNFKHLKNLISFLYFVSCVYDPPLIYLDDTLSAN